MTDDELRTLYRGRSPQWRAQHTRRPPRRGNMLVSLVAFVAIELSLVAAAYWWFFSGAK